MSKYSCSFAAISYLSLISATQDLIILQYIRCKCSAIGKFLYMGNEIR